MIDTPFENMCSDLYGYHTTGEPESLRLFRFFSVPYDFFFMPLQQIHPAA